MKKRILSLILALAMIVAFVPNMIYAEELRYGDLTYHKYDDHIEITGCNRNVTSVDIPAEIDGLPVTEIGYGAFAYCDKLTNVTIPSSVTSIGNWAFHRCGSLNISVDSGNKNYSDINGVLFNKNKTEIIAYAKDKIQSEYSIPDSVTSIGYEAFAYCESLTSVTIPNRVINIGGNAFLDCISLMSVTIPDSVTSIGEGAFFNCESLVRITIPDSVTNIGNETFYGCSSLTSVTISNGVTSIGDSAFEWCESLTSVMIPNSVTSIGDYAFEWCESLTSVTIGIGVTSIGDLVFYGCSRLTSVMIPSNVTSIGDWAFNDCNSLTDVYYSGSEADWQKIIIEGGNDYLTGAHIHYNSTGIPQISVSELVVEGGSITITAETKNIEGVGELFAVGYDGSKLTASEKLQDGAATLPAEDVKTIKVFCWDSLDTMRPLCEPKTITIK